MATSKREISMRENVTLTNIRPGRASWVAKTRHLLCRVRTWLYCRLRCPWLQYRGFVRIAWSVDIWSPNRHVLLGHNVQLGPGTVIQCDAEIGNHVLIARNVALVGKDDHRFDIPGTTIWDAPRGDRFRVVVQDDVWIGHGAIILSGVTVGRGSVIAAGSVVTKNIPPYVIAAGNPAVVIRRRFRNDQDCLMHDMRLDNL